MLRLTTSGFSATAPRHFTLQVAQCRWRVQAAIDQSASPLVRVFRAITWTRCLLPRGRVHDRRLALITGTSSPTRNSSITEAARYKPAVTSVSSMALHTRCSTERSWYARRAEHGFFAVEPEPAVEGQGRVDTKPQLKFCGRREMRARATVGQTRQRRGILSAQPGLLGEPRAIF